MELQVRDGADRKRWYHQQYKRRRRLGVQVHWSWYRFHADQKSDRCGGVLQRSNSGLENDLRATCTYRRWSGRILRLISIYFHGATVRNVTSAVGKGVGNASSRLHSSRHLTAGQYSNIAVFPFNPMLVNVPDSIQEPHLLIHHSLQALCPSMNATIHRRPSFHPHPQLLCLRQSTRQILESAIHDVFLFRQCLNWWR